jgi:prevent-host-death family protein
MPYAMPHVQPVRLSKDVVPISEFKATVAEHLARLGETSEPLVITQHGKPTGVVLSPAAYDALMSAAYVAGIHVGLADVEAGRTLRHEDAMAQLRARFPRTAPKARGKKKK